METPRNSGYEKKQKVKSVWKIFTNGKKGAEMGKVLYSDDGYRDNGVIMETGVLERWLQGYVATGAERKGMQ